MKKWIFSLMAISLCWFSVMVAHAENRTIRVYFNGMELHYEVNPQIIDGTTMVPFRKTFESLGFTINWDPDSRKITGMKNGQKIELMIGNIYGYVNGLGRKLETAPLIVNGNTLVPLRFIGEACNKIVNWDSASSRITIQNGIEVDRHEKQFGSASYDPQNLSNQLGINRPMVYEENGYIYAIWNRSLSFGNLTFTYYLSSVSKDHQWITQANTFKSFNGSVTSNSYLVVGGNLFWKDSTGIRKLTLGKGGYVEKETVLVDSVHLVASANVEIMYPVYTRDDVGFIYGSKDNLNIYLTGGKANYPLSVKDPHHILSTSGNNQTYFLNTTTHNLNIISGNTAKQMNVDTGEMSYDDNGNDRILQFGPNTLSAYPSYFQGKLYFYFLDGVSNDFYKLGILDDQLNFETRPTDLPSSFSVNSMMVSQNEKEFHLWVPVDFDRRPALEVTTLRK